MLRKLLILGVCAGTSASIPVLYQNNKAAVHTLLQSATASEPTPATASASTLPARSLGRSVEIPSDPRGHFLADFRLNGRRVSAMVDTGATFIAMNRTTARSIGIALAPADFKYRIETANGATQAAAVRIAGVEIGRIRVSDVEAVVLDDSALAETLIGMSFLKRLDRYGVADGALMLVQ